MLFTKLEWVHLRACFVRFLLVLGLLFGFFFPHLFFNAGLSDWEWLCQAGPSWNDHASSGCGWGQHLQETQRGRSTFDTQVKLTAHINVWGMNMVTPLLSRVLANFLTCKNFYLNINQVIFHLALLFIWIIVLFCVWGHAVSSRCHKRTLHICYFHLLSS